MRAPVLRGSRIGRDWFVVLHDPRGIFTNCCFDASVLASVHNMHVDTTWLEGCWLKLHGSICDSEPDIGTRYALFYRRVLYETDANGNLLEDEYGKPKVLFRVAAWKHKAKEKRK